MARSIGKSRCLCPSTVCADNSQFVSITAVNDYAMQTIEAVSNKGSFSLSRIIPAFSSDTEEAILRSFSDAMDTLARETQRTLLEASASVANLERLQEHLLTIHDICQRENVALGEVAPGSTDGLRAQQLAIRQRAQNFGDDLQGDPCLQKSKIKVGA